MKYSLSPKVRTRVETNGLLLYVFGRGEFLLNETAAKIINIIEKKPGIDEQTILKLMKKEFPDIPKSKLLADIKDFLDLGKKLKFFV